MRRRLLVALLAAFAIAAAAAAPAGAAVRHDQLPLRPGASGPAVAGLQWMISGAHSHRPNVFTVAGTFTGKPNGYFGPRTAAAIEAYKWRLGYPAKWVKPVAGAYFFALLRNQKQRPPSWVATAAARLKTIEPGATAIALKIKAIEISQLGVTEQPLGSNSGPAVNRYQLVTGALGLAWCASFQQWAFLVAGYGTFADDSAGVYYIVDWSAARNYLHAKPKVGALVAFIDYEADGITRVPGSGHLGYVVKITAHGFSSTEGNYANGVHEVYHVIGDRGSVFIYLPTLA